MDKQKTNSTASDRYDISVIRPTLCDENIKLRGKDFSAERLRDIRKALRTLNTLELMAQNIYKFQITKKDTEMNRQLIAAMCNEMTHYQDFQTKLFEYGFRPSSFRWAYWIVGFVFGFGSRILGKAAILKTGIWVESKAVHHYAQLLDSVDFDADTRKVVEKNQADEDGHISRWRKMLEPL